MSEIKKLLAILTTAIMVLALAGCGADRDSAAESSAWDEHRTGSMELRYADQFHVDYYDDGISVITVEDGLS